MGTLFREDTAGAVCSYTSVGGIELVIQKHVGPQGGGFERGAALQLYGKVKNHGRWLESRNPVQHPAALRSRDVQSQSIGLLLRRWAPGASLETRCACT